MGEGGSVRGRGQAEAKFPGHLEYRYPQCLSHWRDRHGAEGTGSMEPGERSEVTRLVARARESTSRPLPSRLVERVQTDDVRFTKALFEHDRVTARLLGKRRDQGSRMGYHDNLGSFGCFRNQTSERAQQIGMQAG